MKLTGAVLICVSALLLGVYCSKKASLRLKCCEELLLLMKYIREQVVVNKTPTKVIYSRAPTYFDLSGALEKGLYECCAPACHACGDSELEALRVFSDRVGRGDAEVQKGEFDFAISRLEQTVSSLRARLPQTRKLSVSLFLFFGILIVIIFI